MGDIIQIFRARIWFPADCQTVDGIRTVYSLHRGRVRCHYRASRISRGDDALCLRTVRNFPQVRTTGWRGAARRRLVVAGGGGGGGGGGPHGRRLPRFNFSRSAPGRPNERTAKWARTSRWTLSFPRHDFRTLDGSDRNNKRERERDRERESARGREKDRRSCAVGKSRVRSQVHEHSRVRGS